MKLPLKFLRQNKHFYLSRGNSEETEYFIDQLSIMLGSGIDILTALRSIKAELKSKKTKSIIEDIIGQIVSGSSIWEALNNSGLFPEHITVLIKLGEKSGKLSENLQLIVNQLQKDRLFHSRVRSASMYPLLIFSVTLIVAVGMSWFILPRLGTVFSRLDVELPFITRILIAMGNFLDSYGIIAIPASLTGTAIIIYLIFYHSKSKHIGQYLLFSIPGIKKFILEIELARFGYVLGSLLDAGIPIVNALESLTNSSALYFYKNFYDFLTTNINNGNSFKTSFQKYKNSHLLIPIPAQQIIISGEESAKLPEMLRLIANDYEQKSDSTAKNLSVILEPVLLIIVWLGVVAIAFAIILPIYSLIGGFDK